MSQDNESFFQELLRQCGIDHQRASAALDALANGKAPPGWDVASAPFDLGRTSDRDRARIFRSIDDERARQDEKWGGPDHDDEHHIYEWVSFIVDHAKRAEKGDTDHRRRQMVRVAALAVACIEALDRPTSDARG